MRKSSSRRSRSPTKGWKKAKPTTRTSRRAIKSRCGSKCFLLPKELKFPICTKSSKKCKVDCRGIVSAKVRASQWGYSRVAAKADRLIQKHKCTKKSRASLQKSRKNTRKSRSRKQR